MPEYQEKIPLLADIACGGALLAFMMFGMWLAGLAEPVI